jgi:nucleoside-diphosphate-sugar epimerase
MSHFTVLGATGTIGSRLLTSLRMAGHQVDAPGREDTRIFTRPLGHAIYCIGVTADFRTRPLDTVEAHVCLLRRLLAGAQFESLTYLSSTRVYGGEMTVEMDEDAPLRVNPNDPSDLYNLSKLMGESLCLHAGRRNTRAVRLSNVVGGEAAGSANFIPALVSEAKAGKITLRSDPESAKDYIHIDDVVALLPRIAAEGTRPLYNLASGIQVSHRAWVQALAAHFGAQVEYTPGAPRFSFAPISIARITAEFSAAPRPALETFLAGLPRR